MSPRSRLESTFVRGRSAERAALRWLRRRGFRTVERNVRTPYGELDLLTLEGSTLCFVEVKAKTGSSHGVPVEALSVVQRQRILRAAAWWVAQSGWEGECRFDVVSVVLDSDRRWRCELFRGAFEGE